MLLMVSDAVVLLVNVTTDAEDVALTAIVGKLTLVGLTA
jgi:hypothetical protein